jgi:hypothetical protein
MDISSLTISLVISRLDKKGIEQKVFFKNKEFEKVNAILAKFEKLIAKSDSNILIKDMQL